MRARKVGARRPQHASRCDEEIETMLQWQSLYFCYSIFQCRLNCLLFQKQEALFASNNANAVVISSWAAPETAPYQN